MFVIALVLQSFANLLLQFLQRFCVAHVLRKIVVQLRQLLGLDSQHFHGIVIFLSRKLWVGIIRGILHVKILVVAHIRAFQVRIERLHRLFRADVAQHAVGLQRIAAALRRAQQFHLREVAVLDRPAFHGRKCRCPLPHFFQSFRDVFVGDVHRGHFQFQPFVTSQFEFRQHVENRAKLQRLPLIEVQLVHFRL